MPGPPVHNVFSLRVRRSVVTEPITLAPRSPLPMGRERYSHSWLKFMLVFLVVLPFMSGASVCIQVVRSATQGSSNQIVCLPGEYVSVRQEIRENKAALQQRRNLIAFILSKIISK